MKTTLLNSALLCAAMLLAAGTGASAREVRIPSSKSESVYSHYVNGLILERRGDLRKALKEYNALLQIDPSATVILRHRAGLHLKMGESEKALADAEAYVKSHPDEVEGLDLLGNIQLALGRTEEAKETLEKLLKQDTGNAEALLTLAGLVMTENPAAARNLLQRLIQIRPESGEGYYYLGVLEQKQGNASKARTLFEKVAQVDPDSLPALILLGQMSENSGDLNAALRSYGKALDLNPDNFALRMQLVLLHSKRQELGAIEKLLTPYQDDPNAPVEVHLWLGIVNENKKDWARAIRHYEQAQRIVQNPEIALRLASLHSQAGNPEQSVKVLRDLVKKYPDVSQFHYFLGLSYADLKKSRPALRAFDRATELNPGFSQAWFQKGVALDALGRWPEAERALQETIRVDSSAASAYNYLGYTYADRGIDLIQAEKLVARALALEPENPAFLDSFGWILFKKGDYAGALRRLQVAAGLLADPVIYDHLGDCHRALGDASSAASSYARALALDPKNRAVAKKIEMLNAHLVPTSPARALLYRFRGNLWRARHLSGAIFVRAQAGAGAFFPAGRTQGVFYFRNGHLGIESVGPTKVRVDLADAFMAPPVTLRYQSPPREQWRVFPPEITVPQETEMILATVASFLDGRMLEVFDSTETAVSEERGAFVLTRGDARLTIGKKDGLPREVRLKDRTFSVDLFRKTADLWLPEKLRLSWADRVSPLREVRIEFPQFSLEDIESRVFEPGKNP